MITQASPAKNPTKFWQLKNFKKKIIGFPTNIKLKYATSFNSKSTCDLFETF